MHQLKLSDSLTLPVDAVTQTFAILAKRGAGKTYTAAVLAEELLKARQQVLIIDPTGASWGLRSAADGKAPGFPIVVIGGDHGDLPLEENAGEALAAAAVGKFSAIIDLSAFRKGQTVRFVTGFFEALYRLNREPCHLIVDEADTFAPQRLFGDEARMCGALEDVVKKGRIRGLGCTLITQRPAVLNKNVLTQVESLFAMRLTHPRDIGAIREWVGVHSTEEEAAAVVASLPSLPTGEAWFWSPGWMQTLRRIEIRRRETFDSSATPKAGERRKNPKHLAPVDLNALGDQIRQAADQARQNDPRELRRQLTSARAEIATLQKAKPAAAPAKETRVEVPVIRPAELKCLEVILTRIGQRVTDARDLAEKLSAAGESLKAAIGQGRSSGPAVDPQSPIDRRDKPHAPQPAGHAARTRATEPHPRAAGQPAIGGGLRRMMIALAQRPAGLSDRQLAVRACLAAAGGSFGTYLGRGRSQGWIAGERERLTITPEGLTALGTFEPLPTGPALLEFWIGELGTNGGCSRMLRALVRRYPESVTKSDLGAAADVSTDGGSFGTYLGKLRSLELVTGKSELRASDELFE